MYWFYELGPILPPPLRLLCDQGLGPVPQRSRLIDTYSRHSLAGQPLHKREEEGYGIVPMRELYLLQPGVQPNQIVPRHHHYYGRSQTHELTNQVPDLLVQ